ncbi:MAG TPA: C4-type zinc ribbon domain-containing protein [Candidatus Sulfopaludibacter sp.]|nr:C4-type zinc ribbon domain-containing protein [Candidatus Sulfopaludibacter sp.]
MNTLNELLQNLNKLQSLEFGDVEDKNTEAAMAELRAKIPPQILGHYDRLVAKGKKGITPVRDQVCTGCHMRVPIGGIMALKHGEDIQLCENCGRYLYLAPDVPAEPAKSAEATAGAKPARKGRKTKKSLQAA